MTSSEFVYWVKGYLAAQTDSQFKIDIEKALDQVKDYDDNPDIWETEDWNDWYNNETPLTGTISGSGTIGCTTNDSSRYTTTVWNDKMGCWHYTNYPEGFGYYVNSTAENKKEKQQLND